MILLQPSPCKHDFRLASYVFLGSALVPLISLASSHATDIDASYYCAATT
jgi:hypothetical protein